MRHCEFELVVVGKDFSEIEKWSLRVGCYLEKDSAKGVGVRIMGLLLHLWSVEVFRSVGNGCGGFLAVDQETMFLSKL